MPFEVFESAPQAALEGYDVSVTGGGKISFEVRRALSRSSVVRLRRNLVRSIGLNVGRPPPVDGSSDGDVTPTPYTEV
jgi:hypothetical protein